MRWLLPVVLLVRPVAGGAEALKGYMSILDKFIDDSDPMTKKLPPPSAPQRAP